MSPRACRKPPFPRGYTSPRRRFGSGACVHQPSRQRSIAHGRLFGQGRRGTQQVLKQRLSLINVVSLNFVSGLADHALAPPTPRNLLCEFPPANVTCQSAQSSMLFLRGLAIGIIRSASSTLLISASCRWRVAAGRYRLQCSEPEQYGISDQSRLIWDDLSKGRRLCRLHQAEMQQDSALLQSGIEAKRLRSTESNLCEFRMTGVKKVIAFTGND